MSKEKRARGTFGRHAAIFNGAGMQTGVMQVVAMLRRGGARWVSGTGASWAEEWPPTDWRSEHR